MIGSGNTVAWWGTWSIQGRILPYLEQSNIANAANFTLAYGAVQNSSVVGTIVSAYLCPSEIKPQPRVRGTGFIGVLNYAFCVGDWYVWGGFSAPENRAAFGPNRSRRLADFVDGTSNTMLASEVKAYQGTLSNCPPAGITTSPNNIPAPNADPYTVAIPNTSKSRARSAPTATPSGSRGWRRTPASPRPGPRTSGRWVGPTAPSTWT
jgi:hypothetical protein